MRNSPNYIICASFCLVGFYALFLAGIEAWRWSKIQSWEVAPAYIQTVKLDKRSSKDSTTYQILATYTYQYDGETYTSDRVDHSKIYDNNFKFHHERYEELKRAMNFNQKVPCYVNPDDPTQAILYRNLRFSTVAGLLFFGIIFSSSGFGLHVIKQKIIRENKYKIRANQHYPDKPWFIKKDWAAGRITHDSRGSLLLIGFFTLLMNSVAIPSTYMVITSLNHGFNTSILFYCVFIAMGILSIYMFVNQILRWFKYGNSTFIMDPAPGVIGGELSGRIITNARIAPEQGFHLELKLTKQYEKGNLGYRQSYKGSIWEDAQKHVKAISHSGNIHTEIPVHFEIPDGLQESNDDNIMSQYVWLLEVSAATPGVDYQAKFEVPVFEIQRVE
ncbi:DUF3592 domain-containing protein [bacterium]|nr:DUF3592 domain-containing protein [bacterium]